MEYVDKGGLARAVGRLRASMQPAIDGVERLSKDTDWTGVVESDYSQVRARRIGPLAFVEGHVWGNFAPGTGGAFEPLTKLPDGFKPDTEVYAAGCAVGAGGPVAVRIGLDGAVTVNSGSSAAAEFAFFAAYPAEDSPVSRKVLGYPQEYAQTYGYSLSDFPALVLALHEADERIVSMESRLSGVEEGLADVASAAMEER